MIPGRKPQKRNREDYSIRPEEKALYWEQIIEAAKVVIEKGGADIKFVPPMEDSERLYRERNKQEQKWLRETISKK